MKKSETVLPHGRIEWRPDRLERLKQLARQSDPVRVAVVCPVDEPSLTALDGMPMGRRSGEIGPGVVLHLIPDRGLSPEEAQDLLCNRSGLLGVSGFSSEMNDLRASTPPARKRPWTSSSTSSRTMWVL